MTEILLGTLAYVLVTFPYAVVWHMKIFRRRYEAWGYFGDDPKPLFGLLAMVFQGAILSWAYGFVALDHASVAAGLGFAGVMGLFFWTCHVLSYMAKHAETRSMGFLGLETVYLAGQFGAFGVLIALIHRSV